MTEITLQDNQAALILTANGDDIEVDISHEGHVSLAAGLCEVLAIKLLESEEFRQELLVKLQENIEEDQVS
ncbi:MAG: hypothetical protein H8E41_10995 [Desulfobulbaceae bacterium]|uniref:Uncharacterized protein n=1 Tax=Candidatus Desulfobia pelagia TaxID=2841692 RepID=A0A8J6NEX6_9BACT|nr:hypothetical protein [Candidatus Desulfobia pelagia]